MSVQSCTQNPASLKRKSPSDEDSNRLPTPSTSVANSSREPSVLSISSDGSDQRTPSDGAPLVYNGVLQRREGWLVARKSKHASVTTVNAKNLPTPEMLEQAATSPTAVAREMIRTTFMNRLQEIRGPPVTLENFVDLSTPSLDFNFIDQFVLREGVHQAEPGTFVGCTKCTPHMGQGIGCEYTQKCECLEFAAVDEGALKRGERWAAVYEKYKAAMANEEFFDTTGLPKRFPYQKPINGRPGFLVCHYRNTRNAIYECNQNCGCGNGCKNRNVQFGRKVPLVIFKTKSRGWGLKCKEDLVMGEFIDTYLGEIITNEEADRREVLAGKDKASYLYNLDKFVGDGDVTEDNCYVVDGQYMGNPTRFINHSCDPNCRQYTVSYNKYDLRVYDLAFFAYRDIPAGEELTFDYLDKDDEEEKENDILASQEAAATDTGSLERKRCHCGADRCRGYLWV